MGLFSTIAGFIGGNKQKKASKKATAAQIEAINRGIDLQEKQYDQSRSDYAPYLAAGTQGLSRFSDLSGLNGADAMSTAVGALKADPFFQQNLDDANTNLLQNASATGGIRGGDTQGAIGELSPRLLQAYYQQALGNFKGVADLGVGATGNIAQLGANNAQNISGLYGDIGAAQARDYLTRAGISAQQLGNIGGFLDKKASGLFPSGGSSSGGFSLGGALKSIFG